MSPSFGSSTELASSEGMSGVRGSRYRQQTLNLAPVAYWRLGEPIGYRAAVIATAPVGYWRLGESSGTNAADEMGLYDGTYVATPTLATAGLLVGDTDTAVTFALASSQRVTIAVPFGTTPSVSMFVWVTPTATGLAAATSLFGGAQGVASFAWGAGNGLLAFGAQNVAASISIDSELVADTTYMLGVTYNGSTQAVTYYKNGVAFDTDTFAASNFLAGNVDGLCFYGSTVNIQHLDGVADEAAIWDRALSAAEVATLYAAGMNAVTDETGSYDGTYVNTPTLATAGLLAGDADTSVAFAAASSEYVSLGTVVDVSATAGTWAAWINTTSSGSDIRIISKRNTGAAWDFYMASTGYTALFMVDAVAASVSRTSTPGAVTVNDGASHFVTAVRTGDVVRFFVDGAQVGVDQTAGGIGSPVNGNAAHISKLELNGGYFDGTIDEAAIWDRALTAGETKLLYQTGKSGSQI